MTYTSHGHHIPGTVLLTKKLSVARCGGLKLCIKCQHEAHCHPHFAGPLPLEGETIMNEVVSIPEDFIPRNFQMDPETDDLIRGPELENDMIVLLEDTTCRENPEAHLKESHTECDNYKCVRIMESARWCKVTRLERRRGNELLSFIGVYHDGTKRSRTYSQSFYWFVKLDSISKKDD